MGKFNSELIVKKMVASARAFLARHSGDAAVKPTFVYFTNHLVARLNQKRLRVLLDRVQARSEQLGKRLLVMDIACGGGLITSAMAELENRSLGLDLDPEEIRVAKLFAQEEKKNGVFLQADVLQSPDWERKSEEILGGPPDVIILAYALHHLPDTNRFLDRLSRWAPKGTWLLINEENPLSPLFKLKHRVRTWIQKDTETEWHKTFEAWKEQLESHGFVSQDPLIGVDPLYWIERQMPEKAWSLVFTAQRS